MAREMARAAGHAVETTVPTSPFILWEGGDAESTVVDRGDGEPLALAMESPSLFAEGTEPTPDRLDADCGATAAIAVPVPSPRAMPRRRQPSIRELGSASRAASLDWRMILASALLFLAMALGAMAVRGAALEVAYDSLSWEEHRVVAGETIGSILVGRDLPDVGLGRLVDWVEERNGLAGATVVPGQTLSVPV